MARRYRNRRYFRKRGRWSSNIGNVEQGVSYLSNRSSFTSLILCKNPIQSADTISQKYTIKNVEFQFIIEADSAYISNVENLCVYLVYVPQGYSVQSDFINYHPEYIMGYKFLGTPNDDNDNFRNPLIIKSRLARKLNTGDSINLVTTYTNDSSNTVNGFVRGVVRWWSKAN